MEKDFEVFLAQMTKTNATLDYFVDFEKAKNNLAAITLKLHQLNFLLGKENLKEAVIAVYQENPKAFEVLGILLSVRDARNTLTLDANLQTVSLSSYFYTVEQIMRYLQETGLVNIFRNRDICNLVDYVFGIEVGLSSHGRKNRSGAHMVKAISAIFDKENIFYQEEVHSSYFPEIVSLGADIKKFDFVAKTKKKTYLIETNYYNTSGSKPNEVARAYSEVAGKINQYPAYEFVWITDGQGWMSSKKQLQEAWQLIPRVYNLASLRDFVKDIKKEQVIENW